MENDFNSYWIWIKVEIGIIDNGISRIDDIVKTHRNWAVVTWSGSIAVLLKEPDLRKFIVLTALLPILFRINNVRRAYFQQAFIFRERKISDFLNSDNFFSSFEQRKFVNFRVLDPMGYHSKKDEDYCEYVSLKRAFKLKEIIFFYLGMIIISLFLAMFLLLV